MELATAVVAIVKVAEVAPAATVTVAGGIALALLEDRLTRVPPDGAGPLRVTIPVEEDVPTTVLGETIMLATPIPGGVIVSVDELLTPPELAVIVAVVSVVTGIVDTTNVAVFDPPATITKLGTEPDRLLLDRVTMSPPAGATELSVTVAVDGVPPNTDEGFKMTLVTGTVLTWVPIA